MNRTLLATSMIALAGTAFAQSTANANVCSYDLQGTLTQQSVSHHSVPTEDLGILYQFIGDPVELLGYSMYTSGECPGFVDING